MNEPPQNLSTAPLLPTPPPSSTPQGVISAPETKNSIQDDLYKLYKEVERLKDDLKEKKDEIKDTRNVAVIGFVILLVTVGMYFAQTIYEKKSSYDALLEKVYSFQEKVYFLQTQIQLQERDSNLIKPEKRNKERK